MTTLVYTKHERVSLKRHANFNERWLQERIAEEPSILGLGDLDLIEQERQQERAGRLDLLLSDPDSNTRFEVELMLGQTDASHVIRCIEYWDIERRRYPGHEHIAVLVAEDITSRFLNILTLFAGSIPLIGIQLNALQVGDNIVLDFVRVIDQRLLREDDEVEAKATPVDRSYWESRSSVPVLKMIDEIHGIINETADPQQQLNYNKHFIGLTDGTRSRNFVHFRPRKAFAHVTSVVGDPASWVERLEEVELAAVVKRNKLRLTLSPKDFAANRELVTELLNEAVANHQG